MSNTTNVLTMDDAEFMKDFDKISVEAPAVVVETVVDPVDPAPVVTDPVEPVDPAPVDPAPVDPVDPAPTDSTPVDPAPVVLATAEPDYKAFYESIIGKPIKAAGKEIILKDASEAVQLVQMGVGFHSKMSKIAHAERIIETLRENDLLSDEKINELIDISKKNPEAIAALVQSAGLEPHQLIPSGDAQPYTPGNHVLPEAQLQFRTSVDNIREQGGEEFLAHVAQDWDVTSRAEIYKDPNALDMIYGHKQSGLYDQISSEVSRRKVFDPTVAKLPFIHAYLAVGNEMHERGLLVPQQATTDPAPVETPPVPVAVKPAVASQPVNPNPAAAKAASVRSTSTPASATPNFLTMSDEEFKKHHMTPV